MSERRGCGGCVVLIVVGVILLSLCLVMAAFAFGPLDDTPEDPCQVQYDDQVIFCQAFYGKWLTWAKDGCLREAEIELELCRRSGIGEQ